MEAAALAASQAFTASEVAAHGAPSEPSPADTNPIGLVDPRIARDYVYADDVSEAFVRAAVKPHPEPGPVFNVGSGTQTTLRQVVTVARRVLSIPVKPKWGTMPNRQWDTSVWVSDNRAIRRALGWKPRYDFERGFKQMVAWMRMDPARADWYRAAQEP